MFLKLFFDEKIKLLMAKLNKDVSRRKIAVRWIVSFHISNGCENVENTRDGKKMIYDSAPDPFSSLDGMKIWTIAEYSGTSFVV